MEVSLQLTGADCCRTIFIDRSHFKIKPFLGYFPAGRKIQPSSKSSSWRKDYLVSGISYRITASADFSRRRERKTSTPRPKESAPKGFTPRQQVRTSSQGRDPRSNEEKEGPSSIATTTNKTIEKKVDTDEKQIVEIPRAKKVDEEKKNDIDRIVEEVSPVRKLSAVAELRQLEEDEKSDTVDEDDSPLKLKLEMEANLRLQALQRLAGVNFSKGNKMFCYPEVVRPGQTIEIFLNKTLSSLNSETDVMIMGAFNDWRWKSFTLTLNKTSLTGDWWACQFHVPKEAYKIDFVFFNGKDVYENNETKDFCIIVEGGIDVFEFEDILLEEKWRDLEKLAKEQAEREREAEERRRIEAEKAGIEADRTQARGEAERRRGILQDILKKAVKSVDDLWYIEPSEIKDEDVVRLYYNRSLGPLANANDIWIHGGYNNWKDGLSIVESLVSSERMDGDWWYADGRHEKCP